MTRWSLQLLLDSQLLLELQMEFMREWSFPAATGVAVVVPSTDGDFSDHNTHILYLPVKPG